LTLHSSKLPTNFCSVPCPGFHRQSAIRALRKNSGASRGQAQGAGVAWGLGYEVYLQAYGQPHLFDGHQIMFSIRSSS
jgi:hypothetical protein